MLFQGKFQAETEVHKDTLETDGKTSLRKEETERRLIVQLNMVIVQLNNNTKSKLKTKEMEMRKETKENGRQRIEINHIEQHKR